MPSPSPRTILTPRDHQLLGAVALCPLTAAQLRRVSRTFALPFRTEHRVRQRLRQLVRIGLLRRCAYATTGPGTLCYYLLTREGFRVLFGRDAPPPQGWFEPVSRSYEAHTHLLADVLTHAVVCAHREGLQFCNFQRENSLRLEVLGAVLRPDAAFDLVTPDGRTYSFFVEVDNRTEPLRSRTERNSLARKVREYEAWADSSPRRFRVLFVTRGGTARVQHFLGLARELARNPDRSLFYGVTAAKFLEIPSLGVRHLLNHRGERVALVEWRPERRAQPTARQPALAGPEWRDGTSWA